MADVACFVMKDMLYCLYQFGISNQAYRPAVGQMTYEELLLYEGISGCGENDGPV